MICSVGAVLASDRYITLASTTSTENSGLFDHLLPAFTKKTGIEVRVVAVGTGKAIKMAQSGDADVLFVHHRDSEDRFVAEGYGLQRYDVMYNDFVIVGPANDPASLRSLTTVTEGLNAIVNSESPFTSRGDDSGTHKKELSLWEHAGIDAKGRASSWYRETGTGMGATLNVASGINSYTLTDRATWLKFANKGELQILIEGDPMLFNQYGVIGVNPDKHPHVKRDDARALIEWLISQEGQELINAYQIVGQQGFFANANK
ncbi:MAG: extracellular solute-binding protein [Acidiferrobacterales bacterium]|nr:extracellular solute-binding protein [Acidiferrobacterales bacterium]